MTNEASTDEPMHEIASPKDGVESWNDEQRALDAFVKYCREASYDEHYNDLMAHEMTIRAALTRDYLKEPTDGGENG